MTHLLLSLNLFLQSLGKFNAHFHTLMPLLFFFPLLRTSLLPSWPQWILHPSMWCPWEAFFNLHMQLTPIFCFHLFYTSVFSCFDSSVSHHHLTLGWASSGCQCNNLLLSTCQVRGASVGARETKIWGSSCLTQAPSTLTWQISKHESLLWQYQQRSQWFVEFKQNKKCHMDGISDHLVHCYHLVAFGDIL